jgi:hypothetical protein
MGMDSTTYIGVGWSIEIDVLLGLVNERMESDIICKYFRENPEYRDQWDAAEDEGAGVSDEATTNLTECLEAIREALIKEETWFFKLKKRISVLLVLLLASVAANLIIALR